MLEGDYNTVQIHERMVHGQQPGIALSCQRTGLRIIDSSYKKADSALMLQESIKSTMEGFSQRCGGFPFT